MSSPIAATSSVPQLSDAEWVDILHRSYAQIRTSMGEIIVGLDDVIQQVTIAILCGGHCMLEGVPGVAKTKLISTLARLLHLQFRRIQFTPDLMPADITGSDILDLDPESGRRTFRFVQGPLFGQVILADEINRTPPKTQSSLLEAMEERQLSVGGRSYPLPQPFFVLATQNPIEQEGTYPLPEAQLDRFLLKVILDYPPESQEFEIVRRSSGPPKPMPAPVIDGPHLIGLQQLIQRVPAADHVIQTATRLVRSTRPRDAAASQYTKDMISWGAGPRASIALVQTAKARALLLGRHHATEEDVLALAQPVLRHRIMPTFNAEAEGITPDHIIGHLMAMAKGGKAPVPAKR